MALLWSFAKCYRDACKISEQSGWPRHKSRSLKSWRHLTIRLQRRCSPGLAQISIQHTFNRHPSCQAKGFDSKHLCFIRIKIFVTQSFYFFIICIMLRFRTNLWNCDVNQIELRLFCYNPIEFSLSLKYYRSKTAGGPWWSDASRWKHHDWPVTDEHEEQKGIRLIVGTWWRHQMETFSALLVLCEGIHRSPVNSPHKGQRRGVWCLLWSAPEQTVEQSIETPVIWDAIALIMTSL